MLEYNFNELDNDFITIWAKFIVEKQYRYLTIKKDLDKLAELGQVNAMQSYYLFMREGDKSNKLIDENVEKLDNNSFNNLFAKAHKMMFEQGFMKAGNPYNDVNKRQNFEVCKLLHDASKRCLAEFYATNNLLCLLRYGEIATTKNEKSLFKKLCKKEKIDLQNAKQPNQVYAIAKHLYFFGNKAQKRIAFQQLENLSKRLLSNTLQEYQLKHRTENKISQQEEKIKSKNFLRDNIDSIYLQELVYTGKNVHTKESEQQEVEKYKKFLNSKTYAFLNNIVCEDKEVEHNNENEQQDN